MWEICGLHCSCGQGGWQGCSKWSATELEMRQDDWMLKRRFRGEDHDQPTCFLSRMAGWFPEKACWCLGWDNVMGWRKEVGG